MDWKHKLLHTLSYILHGEPPITKANIVSLSPNQLLQNRCAIITGGTSGIGYAIAKSFLQAGAIVIITGRSQQRIDKACSELSIYGSVLGYVVDNTQVSSFDNALTDIRNMVSDKAKCIDILVNNAGIGTGLPIPNTTETDWDATMDTNLKGTYFLSQSFGKYLKDNKIHGNILNITSSSCLRFGTTPYVISKWGIRSLTLGLAKALAPYGITVNAVAPGPTATPMLRTSFEENLTLPNSPIRRFILPDEIANAAVFMVSDMGKAAVGDTLYMTGGAGILTQDDVSYNF